MVITGDQWPVYLYAGYTYDPEDPWNGLCRSPLLVCVSIPFHICKHHFLYLHRQGYRHIFTSPSSVEKEPKATRSGNARIHGMTRVTTASIAYVATQVTWTVALVSSLLNYCQIRFALSSSPVFSRTDTTTDSETFYTSILQFLDDPEEISEVNELMTWWNR